jgi:hypothetical protein
VEIFAAQGWPPVLLTPVANGKNLQSDKYFDFFWTHLLTPVANLPPVSLTPVANLPLVSTTLAKMVEKFVTGVIDTSGAL